MLALLVAALLAACGGNYGCGKGRSKVFDTPASSPRAFTVVLRSYRGSREGLLSAAIGMMAANPRFGKLEWGATPIYLAQTNDEPAQAVDAVTFENSMASVTELLDMLSAVTERLTPEQDLDPSHPTLKLELWWVEGIHEKAMGLELPNPLILEERWANSLFVVGSEPYFAWSVEERRESRVWGIRVALMFEVNQHRGSDPRVIERGHFSSFTTTEESGLFTYELKGRTEADLIARCADLSFVIDVHHQRYASDATTRTDQPQMQADLADEIVEKRALSWVEAVNVQVPAGASLAQRCRLWLDGCRHAAKDAHLAASRSVIFDQDRTTIRGVVLGERGNAQSPVPNVTLEEPITTETLLAFEDGHLRGFTASLQMRVPGPSSSTR